MYGSFLSITHRCVIVFIIFFCLKDTRIVGPFQPTPAKPLPDELEQFMRTAGDEGVILVSFGSLLEEITGLEETLLRMMADAFSKVPQKIIWKLKSGGRSTK